MLQVFMLSFFEAFVMYFQEKNPQEKPAGDVRKNYEEIVRENAVFEEYYKVIFLFVYIYMLGLT